MSGYSVRRQHIGVIGVPEYIANLNRAGRAGMTSTARATIYRIRLKVPGNRVLYM